MKTIWKQSIPVDDQWHVVAGNIVHAEAQFGPESVEVWFETPVEPFKSFEVCIFGTGHLIPDNATHVGSWVSPNLVWHAYARDDAR